MPVNDPFGPSVYVPDLNTGAGSASQGWATGISNLAKGLFPDPNSLADARYKNTQTQLLNTQAAARSNLAGFFANPNAAADPNNRAQIYSWMTTLPADEQNAWHNNLAGVIQNVPSMTQAQRDQYNAGAGMVPAGNTPSGFNAQLQNQVNTATIGANAQRDVAGINQTNENYRWGNTPAPATSSGQGNAGPAGPVLATPNQVNAAPPGTYMPNYQNPADTATVLGGRGAQQAPPSHGVSPPPAATQPQTGSQGGPATTTNPAPTNTDTPAGAASTNLTAAGQRGQLPTNQAKEGLDFAIDTKAAEVYGKPGWFGLSSKAAGANDPDRYRLSPDLKAQVATRANQLMLSPATKGTFGSVDAAVNQAWNDVIEPLRASGKLDTSRHMLGGGQPEIHQTGPATPTTPMAPAPAPAPPAPAPPATTPPAATPVAPSGTSALPKPAPATPPVRYTAPAPAAAKPAAAKPAGGGSSGAIQPGAVWGNRVYTSGDPNNAANWGVATAAQIATARKNGNYRQ